MLYTALALLIVTGRIAPWHVYGGLRMAIVAVVSSTGPAAMVADAVRTSPT